MTMKISILGTGRWASCIAFCMDRKGYDVLMWEREHADGHVSELFASHKNGFVTLSDRVDFTHDLASAVGYGEVIIISILSQNLDSLIQQVRAVDGYQNKKYCIAMKGVESSTGRRLSEILIDAGIKRDNIAVWVGPGHVQSIFGGQPTNMIVSAYNARYAHNLVKSFETAGVLDIASSDDIIGTEFGAAAKNVIGIAAGVLEGSNLEQKKGPLMPASVKEIGKFIDALGGDPRTASGLAFLGDFQATLFDHNSKNLTLGRTIIDKMTTDREILSKYINVDSVEGVKTAEALLKVQRRYNERVNNTMQIKMPITSAVHEIISGKVRPEQAGEYISRKITEALEL
mgnify:CR=1 FL=1